MTAIRSRGYGPEHFEYTDTARRGECGILFPTVLLLFEAHHARGKLDTCRLTPKCLLGQDASTSSLLLGIENHRGEQVASIYVADMREDGYVHPEFCAMGKKTFLETARGFLEYLAADGSPRAWPRNALMDFLDVDYTKSGDRVDASPG